MLVNTNRMKPVIAPLGLDYLADTLRETGHEPYLLDLCLAEFGSNEIRRKIDQFSPDLVGVTIRNTDDCYFTGQSFFLPEIKKIVRLLQAISGVPVVLGGVGFSTAPSAILEYCQADLGVAGEGELALPCLLAALERGDRLTRVPNLVYRSNGSVIRNPMVDVDLARLPIRRRTFVDNPYYFRRGGQAGFETKRGCAMKCLYCADPLAKGRSIRLLPPQRVIEELTAIMGQGIDHLHTCDSEFNLPQQHAQQVCKAMIAGGMGDKVRWYAYCAPTPFDEESATLMKRAGCAGINFGVDSACDSILRNLGRHFTASDLHLSSQLCRRHQIPFMYDLLMGGPGETYGTIRETIDFVRRLEPDCVGISMGLRVYPETPLAHLIQSHGKMEENPELLGETRDNSEFMRPVFYISPELGEDFIDYVHDLVAGDRRFFLPGKAAGESNCDYNYDGNDPLVQAIGRGARGAYWDILRQLSF